jgi:hypothetical protein
MEQPSETMVQRQQEIREHERWLAEYTDRLRSTAPAAEPAAAAPGGGQRCWQCDAASMIALLVGTVRVQFCTGCAAQALQVLAVALWAGAGQP